MDGRSWLWRRKSSEKSPGETESTGSVSSHSERFSDDQGYPTHSSQSPEITSKAAPNGDNIDDSAKTLTEKLSAALLDISTKEELVQQHARVAEEAVSGWEKAENEVLDLRQQLEAVAIKNATLEDRVGHLDGALKECVRQLRQAREEQEHKIHEAVSKKASEWEKTKLDLQSQLVELQIQSQSVKSTASVDYSLRTKLEEVEKENAALRRELLSRAEEVEMRILERDLSSQAAEAASKQHLETKKKVAKLEAECRRLKAIVRKALPSHDIKSAVVSSTSVESRTDSQSDHGEKLLAVEFDNGKKRGLEVSENMTSSSDSLASSLTTGHDQLKFQKAIGRNAIVPSTDINLLDDFVEMERIASLPDTHRSFFTDGLPLSNQPSRAEKKLNSELEAMMQKITELEQKLEKKEAEKGDLLKALIECQEQLQTSQCELEEAAVKLVEFETQLAVANESRRTAAKEVKSIISDKEVTESQLRAAEAEIRTCVSKIESLQKEAGKECALSDENIKICQKLEEELQMSNNRLNDAEANLLELRTQLFHMNGLKQTAEKELKAVHATRELAESQLKDAKAEIAALVAKTGSLEYEVEQERGFSARCVEKCQRLEGEVGTLQSRLKQLENKLSELEYLLTLANELKEVSKKEAEDAIAACKIIESQLGTSQSCITDVENKLAEVEYQLTLANKFKEASKKEAEDAIALSKILECQLRKSEAETQTMTSKVQALEEMVKTERSLSAEYLTKCQKLEDECSTIKHEPELRQYSELHHVATTNFDLKIRQEKESAEAANKLAECQKTIASLSHQLKSLASLDDLFNDFDELEDINNNYI